MSSTGWIIATGAVTMVNEIATTKQIDWIKIPLATGGAVVIGKLFERVSPELATMIAVIGFVTVVFAPLAGRKAPAQTIVEIFEKRKAF